MPKSKGRDARSDGAPAGDTYQAKPRAWGGAVETLTDRSRGVCGVGSSPIGLAQFVGPAVRKGRPPSDVVSGRLAVWRGSGLPVGAATDDPRATAAFNVPAASASSPAWALRRNGR